ncbi:50S ribosomal protein L7/L12 [Candidatus Dependentiae bacterium]
MASNSFDKLIDEIGKMSVLDLADLVKALEDKFGVSAAMPVAAAPAAQAGAQEAEKEEKSAYKVTLKTAGEKKIDNIKALRKVTELSLSDAKKAVEEVPSVIGESVPAQDAQKMKKELEAVGATVELS